MTHLVGLALAALGSVVIVAAAGGAAVMPGGVFNRLHFVTPMTSLGLPLVAVGLSVESGQPFTVAEVLVIALLVGVSGPVLASATGRAAAREQDLLAGDDPL